MTSSFTSTSLTEQNWRVSRRIAHKWYYWPLKLIQDSHAYAFVYIAIAGVGAAALFPKYRTREVLLGALGSLCLSAFLFLITYLIRARSLKKRVAKHNAQMGTWAYSDRGLLFNIGGSLRIERWTAYREAIVSEDLLVLRFTTNRSIRTLSIAGLPLSEREALRAMLRHHLGPSKTKEAPIRRSRLRPNVVHRP